MKLQKSLIKKSLFIFLALVMLSTLSIVAQSKPFPQNVDYPGCIKPQIGQSTMNSQIQSYFDYWKAKYVKQAPVTPGGYYVYMEGTGSAEGEITTSEAHGYGMIIFALMGDKTYYDGMYSMYNNHRSSEDKDCMSWMIHETEDTAKDSASATDGDMDVAYSLLLAHSQWGSNGAINYFAEAVRIIQDGIKQSDMSPTTSKVMLGDWGEWHKSENQTDNTADENTTRSSDWIADHLRLYFEVTKDSYWLEAADKIYEMINIMTTKYSPNTGLMPDFIVHDPAVPAPPYFLEGPHDGAYSWNACRYPWRIAMDYAHFGTPEARTAVNKLVNWAKSKHGHPKDILAGYSLDGNVLPDIAYDAMSFTAPIIAACVVDPAHQTYLNWGWEIMTIDKNNYYSDTINLLCQMFISGNWWKPSGFPVVTVTPTPVPPQPGVNLIKAGDFSDPAEAAKYWVYKQEDGGVGAPAIVNGEFKCAITNPGNEVWAVQVGQKGLPMVRNLSYEYSFDAYADAPRSMKAIIGMSGDPWKVFSDHNIVQLTRTKTKYTFTFDMKWWSDYNGQIEFDFGKETPTVYIDNVVVKRQGNLIDFAVNKPIFSSGDYAPQFGKKNANDGNDNTVWGSKLAKTGSQWIFIDLGAQRNVQEVVIKWFGNFYARRYSIGVSNDAQTWTLTQTIDKAVQGTETHAEVQTCRYVGILCTQANDIAYGIATINVNGTN